MKIDIKDWLLQQTEELQKEIKDIKYYLQKPINLKELEELDNRFINNPEGNNERATSSVRDTSS